MKCLNTTSNDKLMNPIIPNTSIAAIFVVGSEETEPERVRYLKDYFVKEYVSPIQFRQKTWGTRLDSSDIELFTKEIQTDSGLRKFKPAEISIFLNYISVLEEFVATVKSDDQYAMILESDVIFEDNIKFADYFQALTPFFQTKHPEIVSFGSGCDMIADDVNTDDMNFQIFPERKRVRCMDSFLFSRRGAERFLTYCKTKLVAGNLYNLPIDNYLEEYLKTRADEDDAVQWWIWPSLTLQGSQNGHYKSNIQSNLLDITFITYSHTDYQDIWPLTFHGIKALNNIPMRKVLAMNTSSIKPTIQGVYDDILTYDDTLQYPAKVAQILEQVKTTYVFFVHDIDVILNFNTEQFNLLFEIIQTYDMDRFFFGLFKPMGEQIKVGRFNLTEAKSSPIYFHPYDVGPSIWKRSVFLDMMTNYKSETYRTIETSKIQEDLSEYRCFAFAPSLYYNPYFQLARPVSSDFVFCHILASGKWFPFHVYMDLQLQLKKLLDLYKIDTSIRGVGNGDHLFQISRSLETA